MTIPAIVLAGERPGGNPLAEHMGAKAGVLVEVAGVPCIQRVIRALEGAETVAGGLICGPDEATTSASTVMHSLLASGSFRWLPPADGPADSAVASLEALESRPALLTAADHALLNPSIIDGFCRLALLADADFVVGFVPHDIVRAAFPASKRTVLKFADRHYCGSNLYLVKTPRGEKIIELWRTLQHNRKQPWKMAGAIGAGTLARYLLGRLSVGDALARISELAGCKVACVEIFNARAAVDVDSIADHALAETLLKQDQTEPATANGPHDPASARA